MRLLALLTSLFGLSSGCQEQQQTSHVYQPGQEWTYQAREGEEHSTLTVLKVGPEYERQEIIHISISGLRIPNPESPTGVASEVGHIPVLKESLDRSVIALKGEVALPEGYEQGYLVWLEAFNQGEAGVFSLAVSEVLDIMEQSLTGASQ